ncbi:MAG: RluA family pseudouridine synthase [Acidobacteriaceae bacterium]
MPIYTATTLDRLDKFLAQASGKPRSRVKSLISEGKVKINGKSEDQPDKRLALGDVVEMPEIEDNVLKPSLRELKIVFENSDLAIIDKPAGMIVHPGAGNSEDSLSQALLTIWPFVKDVGQPHRPGIVHRLDEDTSGLIVVAKNQDSYEYLKDLFLNHKVEKKYLALVHGIPEKLHGIIDVPLDKNFKRRKMVAGTGKEAITEYSVVAQGALSFAPGSLDQVALLKVNLHTGRTHQIRVHLASIGHPIVGDKTYGGIYKESDQAVINRQFLHAFRLKFKLKDGTMFETASRLPEDLQTLLTKANITYEDQLV